MRELTGARRKADYAHDKAHLLAILDEHVVRAREKLPPPSRHG